MTATPRRQRLRDRIGGPQATSWPVVAAGVVFIWLLFIAMLLPPEPTEQAIRVGFVVIAQLLMVAILRGSRRTVLRHTAERARPWRTLAVFTIAATAFTATFGSLIKDRPVAPPATPNFMYLATVAIIVVFLLTAAIAADALAQHRHQQEELNDHRERLEHLRGVVAGAIAERQRGIVAQVETQFADTVEQLSAQSPREAVETLRWAAQELVRPLSHDLATRSIPFDPTFPAKVVRGSGWRTVIMSATAGAPVRVLGVPLVSFAVTLLYRTERHGWAVGALGGAVNALAILLGALLANRIMESLAPRLTVWARASLLTVSLAAMGVLGVLAQRVILHSQGTVGSLTVNIALTAFIGWALALLTAAERHLTASEAEIRMLRRELDWEIARANQTQWQQQRALALALHGPLQSAVNAAALRIDAALRADTVTPDLIRNERTSIINAVDQLQTVAADRVTDLELDLRRLKGTWQDLCDIDIAMPQEVLANITADPACASAVSDIVTESCANAIKHAEAKHICVAFSQPESERLVTVVIENDGAPMDPMARRGLGTSLIDDVACEWHSDALPGRTRISVTLPTAIGATRTPR